MGIILILAVSHADSSAQIFSRKHARSNEHPPKAILVQLPTFSRRVSYFEKSGNKEKLNQLKRDADSIASKMILDFKDNLTYCPVYYFFDNDAEQVRNKNLEGNLLNSKLQPVKPPLSNDYFIVLFGESIESSNNSDAYGATTTSLTTISSKKRLQVFDNNYKKLKRPLPDGTNNHYAKSKRGTDAYQYESPMFNINYYPYVAAFNAKLHVFYNKNTQAKKAKAAK